MNRGDLIKDKISNCQQDLVPLVFDYNIQHKKNEKIIQRHILKSDRHLQDILPKRPRFIYRRAPTIRD